MKRRSNKITLYNNVYSQYKPPNSRPSNPEIVPSACGELLMYRYTFASRVALAMAFVLCISLLIQPVSSAYAQENETQTQEELVEFSSNTTPEPEETVEFENTDVPEVEVVEPEPDEEQAQPEAATSTEPETEVLEEVIVSAATTTTTETSSVTSSESILIATSSATESSSTTSPAVNPDIQDEQASYGGSSDSSAEDEAVDSESDNATTTEEEVVDETVDTENGLSTTTLEQLDPTVQEISVVNSDQAIAFNRNECTEVSDGSFYCQKITMDDVPQDALFAAPDNTGDMEIYVVQDGIETKLTDNVMEDASPYFDSRSNTLVWHRLINDRYQIILYDVDAQEETQLTDTRVNNMEPTRSGSYTVWQRWVTNNWEIILFDGETEIQLTDSHKHDIAPNIYGDMIIWNVRSNDGTQSLMTYEISTQTYNQIADTEGVTVANPRMLVTYEAQYQNGDSVLKGFDLATGEIIPIEHLPQQLPTDLPEPDATGETRALPVNTNDEEESEQEEPEPEDSGQPTAATTTAAVSTTTVVTSPDLDLRPADAPVATTTDLIVEQAAIPDVVVPAFEETTSTSTQDT